MATWTKAQLVTRVLENLGELAAGETADTADAERVGEAAQSAYDRLRFEGLCPFDIGEIPDWALTPLRDYVSADCINLFAISGERAQSIRSDGLFGLNQLRRQVHNPRMVRTVRGKYF